MQILEEVNKLIKETNGAERYEYGKRTELRKKYFKDLEEAGKEPGEEWTVTNGRYIARLEMTSEYLLEKLSDINQLLNPKN